MYTRIVFAALAIVVTPLFSEAVVNSINGQTAFNQTMVSPGSNATNTMHMDIVPVGANTHRFRWDGTPWRIDQGGTGTSTFQIGGVLFYDGLFLTQNTGDTGLFWDNTNGRLGVGTNAPSERLTVNGNGVFNGNLTVVNGELFLPDLNPVGEDKCLSIETVTGRILTTGSHCLSGGGGGFGGNISALAMWLGSYQLGSSVLSWNHVHNRLGVGTTTPGVSLDILSAATATARLDSTDSTKGSCIIMKDSDGVGFTYITVNDGVMSASTVPCT